MLTTEKMESDKQTYRLGVLISVLFKWAIPCHLGAGIQTHNLQSMSLPQEPLDQDSHPNLISVIIV